MTEPDRISLSRETLRAELGALELRLVDRITTALATKAEMAVVDQIDSRVTTLELSRAAREHLVNDYNELERRVVKVERFRLAFPSSSVLSAAAAVAAVVYTLLH